MGRCCLVATSMRNHWFEYPLVAGAARQTCPPTNRPSGEMLTPPASRSVTRSIEVTGRASVGTPTEIAMEHPTTTLANKEYGTLMTRPSGVRVSALTPVARLDPYGGSRGGITGTPIPVSS